MACFMFQFIPGIKKTTLTINVFFFYKIKTKIQKQEHKKKEEYGQKKVIVSFNIHVIIHNLISSLHYQ